MAWGSSHHLNDWMCIHSPSARSIRKRSLWMSTKMNIRPMPPNSRYFGRGRIRRGFYIRQGGCDRMPVILEDAYVQEDAVRARNRVVGDVDGRRAGRQKRGRCGLEGDGR